ENWDLETIRPNPAIPRLCTPSPKLKPVKWLQHHSQCDMQYAPPEHGAEHLPSRKAVLCQADFSASNTASHSFEGRRGLHPKTSCQRPFPRTAGVNPGDEPEGSLCGTVAEHLDHSRRRYEGQGHGAALMEKLSV